MDEITRASGELSTTYSVGLGVAGGALAVLSPTLGLVGGIAALVGGFWTKSEKLQVFGAGMAASGAAQLAIGAMRPAPTTPRSPAPVAIMGGIQIHPTNAQRDTATRQSAPPPPPTEVASAANTMAESEYLDAIEQAGADGNRSQAPSGIAIAATRFVRMPDGQVLMIAAYRSRFPDKVRTAWNRGLARPGTPGPTFVVLPEPAGPGASITAATTVSMAAAPLKSKLPVAATTFSANAGSIMSRYTTINR